MTKQISRLIFVIWISVVILTIFFDPKIASADCGGRNYGRYMAETPLNILGII
jgi:hypothetical protein